MTSSVKSNRAQRWARRLSHLFAIFLIFTCAERVSPKDKEVSPGRSNSATGAIHPMTRQSVSPSQDQVVAVNPPSLLWPAVKGKDIFYNVWLSQDPAFPKSETITAKDLRWAIFNPHTKLRSGKWYWQYSIYRKETLQYESKVYSFNVPARARDFVTPTAEEMLSACPGTHPRILITRDELAGFQRRVKNSTEAKSIIAGANRYVGKELPTEESGRPGDKGKSPYENKSYAKWASKALGNRASAAVSTLAKAYIITGDKKFGREAIRYAVRVARWDPDGVTSHRVSDFADGACLRAMALAYDSCYELLTKEEKAQLQKAISSRAGRMFNSWRNNLETRVFSAHIWQHILHEFTEAAFATLGDIADAKLWASYVYELWLARVPLLGGDDGGWANGNNYFGTNFISLISIPTFFERLTGADFIDHPWYRNTIYYMIYTWPPGSCPDGFGDGCERRGLSPLSRLTFADILGRKFNDPYAAWYVKESLKAMGTQLDEDTSLRWHRLRAPPKTGRGRAGYDNASAPAKEELDLPQARLFGDVGVVAMHTKLADTPNNLMLAFRSSPYGSFNHAHADQNSFNILFGGERLFCNSGYYIAYGDEHFQGWYIHSRGHNTVLIDDKGQVLGRTEAYGWLCRYLHGQQITYCLGDASNAYGGTGLTCFRRHILFLRPSIVIIYDELEADHPARWSWLLHSPNEISAEAANNRLLASVETARAQVDLYGSVPLSFEVNNRFDPPALNWRGRKTADGKLFEYPNQWHATVASTTKTAKMRYLAVIQIHNAVGGKAFDVPRTLDNSCIRVGSWELCAELDPSIPPGLEVRSVNGKTALAVNKPSINVGEKRYGSGNPNSTILVEMLPDKNIVAESTEMYP